MSDSSEIDSESPKRAALSLRKFRLRSKSIHHQPPVQSSSHGNQNLSDKGSKKQTLETKAQKRRRLEKRRRNYYEKRQNETEEEKRIRLEKFRTQETQEHRIARLQRYKRNYARTVVAGTSCSKSEGLGTTRNKRIQKSHKKHQDETEEEKSQTKETQEQCNAHSERYKRNYTRMKATVISDSSSKIQNPIPCFTTNTSSLLQINPNSAAAPKQLKSTNAKSEPPKSSSQTFIPLNYRRYEAATSSQFLIPCILTKFQQGLKKNGQIVAAQVNISLAIEELKELKQLLSKSVFLSERWNQCVTSEVFCLDTTEKTLKIDRNYLHELYKFIKNLYNDNFLNLKPDKPEALTGLNIKTYSKTIKKQASNEPPSATAADKSTNQKETYIKTEEPETPTQCNIKTYNRKVKKQASGEPPSVNTVDKPTNQTDICIKTEPPDY